MERKTQSSSERMTTYPCFLSDTIMHRSNNKAVTRQTRGGQAERKSWVMMFCCMTSRAMHIKVIGLMNTSSIINALRFFLAIRGPPNQLMSDYNTIFIGVSKELGMYKEQPNGSVQRYLNQQGCSWEFNPSHASHMGCFWECLFRVARIILTQWFKASWTLHSLAPWRSLHTNGSVMMYCVDVVGVCVGHGLAFSLSVFLNLSLSLCSFHQFTCTGVVNGQSSWCCISGLHEEDVFLGLLLPSSAKHDTMTTLCRALQLTKFLFVLAINYLVCPFAYHLLLYYFPSAQSFFFYCYLSLS